MTLSLGTLLILVSGAFFAGLVDSMAGGGGLISLPLLLACGIPPHLALGTNKVQSSSGTIFSTWRYLRSGSMHIPLALSSAGGALIGSYLGARAVLAIPSEDLSVIVLPLIVVVALITFLRKDFGSVSNYKFATVAKAVPQAVLIGLVIGFYDGFFGPGTGTFLAFAFVFFFGFSFVQATANAKVSNLASNIAAVVAFAFSSNVLWTAAIPMAAANIVGNLLGSGLAIKKGAVVIKPVFALVLAGIFLKILVTQSF